MPLPAHCVHVQYKTGCMPSLVLRLHGALCSRRTKDDTQPVMYCQQYLSDS